MTDYKPLIVSLVIIFVLGFIINLIVSPFVNTEILNSDSFLYDNTLVESLFINPSFFDSVDTDVTFLGVDIDIPFLNPLALLPDTAIDFIFSQLILLSYIPDYFLIPLIILIFIGMLYTIIKLLPFT